MRRYHIRRDSPASGIDYDKHLNPEQHAAVLHGEGPALVLAGAGTGKTRVVTYRVARLIESGVPSENLLLLTFTNKAAREMMRRVEHLVGRNIVGLFGGTFHHVANLLLRQHHRLAGYREGFSIIDREDAKELLESCAGEIYKKHVVLPKGPVLVEMTSLAKNTGRPLPEVIEMRFPHFVPVTAEMVEIADRYEKKKLRLNLADFDDLLLSWKRIFGEHERIREYYAIKFRHILVDEYQDTNRLQADIVDLTIGPERNLMAVGDDAQSIYSFRGADFENILRFPERYPGTAIYKLTTNYRSTPEILNLGNAVISRNERQFRKDLVAVSPRGELPGVAALQDVFEQAGFVASLVTDLNAEGVSLNDMAVLYRAHFQSMELQLEFQRRGIPFEVRSGLTFFEQAHIKDIISYLRILANPRDEISWKRVLKLIPGIGNVTAAKIWSAIGAAESPLDAVSGAAELVPRKAIEGFHRFLDILRALRNDDRGVSPAAAVEQILGSGYEDYLYSEYPNADMRIQDIGQMARFAARYESLESFLSDLALQGVSETRPGEEEKPDEQVVLSTVHQAKGLEWDVVFIIGLNDGKFPSAKAMKAEGDAEEERRLFYVGTTRAKSSLYLCYPLSTDDWQGVGFSRPSRFLREIPSGCFEEIVVDEV